MGRALRSWIEEGRSGVVGGGRGRRMMSGVRHGEMDDEWMSFAWPQLFQRIAVHPSRATTVAVQRIAATTVVEIDKGPQHWLKLKGRCRAPIRPPTTRAGRWSWSPCWAAPVAVALAPPATVPLVACPASAPTYSHRSCSASRSSTARARRGPSPRPKPPTRDTAPLPWMGHPPWHH